VIQKLHLIAGCLLINTDYFHLRARTLSSEKDYVLCDFHPVYLYEGPFFEHGEYISEKVGIFYFIPALSLLKVDPVARS